MAIEELEPPCERYSVITAARGGGLINPEVSCGQWAMTVRSLPMETEVLFGQGEDLGNTQ